MGILDDPELPSKAFIRALMFCSLEVKQCIIRIVPFR